MTSQTVKTGNVSQRVIVNVNNVSRRNNRKQNSSQKVVEPAPVSNTYYPTQTLYSGRLGPSPYYFQTQATNEQLQNENMKNAVDRLNQNFELQRNMYKPEIESEKLASSSSEPKSPSDSDESEPTPFEEAIASYHDNQDRTALQELCTKNNIQFEARTQGRTLIKRLKDFYAQK